MGLSPCRACKKEVSDDAKTCPHCGASEPSESVRAVAGRWLSVLGWIGAIALVVFMVKEWRFQPGVSRQAVERLKTGMDASELKKTLGSEGTLVTDANESALSATEKALVTVIRGKLRGYNSTTQLIAKIRLWRGTPKDPTSPAPVVVVSTAGDVTVLDIAHSDGPW